MKLKKLMTLATSMTIFASLFTGCGQTQPGQAVQNVTELNLTYVKSPLNVPSIIEKNKAIFETAFSDEGIAINYHEITSGPDQTQALAAGELQVLHALGNTSALIAASQDVDLKILNIYSRGPKAFMMLTRNESITSLEDLKGKTIAGPKGTVLHQLLITALEQAGLTEEDVEFVSMGIPDASAALENGSIDVALLAGPNALLAIEAGANIVTTGEGLVDGTIVTAVSGEFYEAHKDIVDEFLAAHNETLQLINDNLDEMLEITAEEVGLTLEQTKEMFSWYDFNSEITGEDIEALYKTQDFLVSNGLQEKAVKIEDFIIQ